MIKFLRHILFLLAVLTPLMIYSRGGSAEMQEQQYGVRSSLSAFFKWDVAYNKDDMYFLENREGWSYEETILHHTTIGSGTVNSICTFSGYYEKLGFAKDKLFFNKIDSDFKSSINNISIMSIENIENRELLSWDQWNNEKKIGWRCVQNNLYARWRIDDLSDLYQLDVYTDVGKEPRKLSVTSGNIDFYDSMILLSNHHKKDNPIILYDVVNNRFLAMPNPNDLLFDLQMILYDGIVYYATETGLYAYDFETQQKRHLWTFSSENKLHNFCLDDEFLYFHDGEPLQLIKYSIERNDVVNRYYELPGQQENFVVIRGYAYTVDMENRKLFMMHLESGEPQVMGF